VSPPSVLRYRPAVGPAGPVPLLNSPVPAQTTRPPPTGLYAIAPIASVGSWSVTGVHRMRAGGVKMLVVRQMPPLAVASSAGRAPAALVTGATAICSTAPTAVP